MVRWAFVLAAALVAALNWRDVRSDPVSWAMTVTGILLIVVLLTPNNRRSKDAVADLIDSLGHVRNLLARPGNDFDWSSWENADAALSEIDGLIEALSAGRRVDPLDMSVLFAVTGPIQEVSLSSGWGDEFLVVADQFDDALKRYERMTKG